jgi:hypothetical protein
MARMQADAYKIFHYVDSQHAQVGTPSFTGRFKTGSTTERIDGHQDMAAYLGVQVPAYGGTPVNYTDILIFHLYGNNSAAKFSGMPEIADTNCTDCESWASHIFNYKTLLNKPLWIDEGGWGGNFQTNTGGRACTDVNDKCGCVDAPKRACMNADNVLSNVVETGSDDNFSRTNPPAPGYLVRAYMQAIAGGIASFYWYSTGADETGSLADCTGGTNRGDCNKFVPQAAGFAWNSMYKWFVGANFDGQGIQNVSGTTQYTYKIGSKNPPRTDCQGNPATSSYNALVVWNIGNTSTQFSCGNYKHYCTLFEGTSAGNYSAGTIHSCSLSGSVFPTGNPILLQP